MVNDRLDQALAFWDFDEIQQAANILVTSMLISPIIHHCRFLRIKSQMPTPRVSCGAQISSIQNFHHEFYIRTNWEVNP
ncbi:protein of unknown function [Magnetospirillum gryphiswaldense MSR-1 v2]|uniref:Uncharacterized protein n=1 Tax=Magnetospirillum gryphiswaldense (strain DSM 6361 / JCM 21280 / NBRC 15271 / MSR-1) TaxID=431944 RepID=V6F5U1_MAGGM|nr:protein of unknown function [Magnetospirillum gryphiswaldense MSR-1 v2]